MDPAQEKLRQHKANWNKEISSFINDIIHFKKMMNGWPSKFYKERSRITVPFPVDVPTLLGQMSAHFNELAQEGGSIAQEQAQYSKTRRVHRKQQGVETLNKLDEKYGPTETSVQSPVGGGTPSAQAPANNNDLAKQLAAFEEKYVEQLVAEASNPLSRTFTRLVNPTVGWGTGTKRRRERMNMLKRSARIYKQLGKLQVRVVAPLFGQESVKDSYEMAHDISNEWSLIKESFFDYKKLMDPEGTLNLTPDQMKGVSVSLENEESNQAPSFENSSVPTQGEPSPPVPPQQSPAISTENLANDIRKELSSVTGSKIYEPALFAPLQASIDKFLGAKLLSPDRPAAAAEVISNYKALLAALSNKYSMSASSLRELEAAIAMKNASIDYQLETTSQAFLKKWLGKLRHNLVPGETSSYRLAIFDLAKQSREEFNLLMNLLEKRKTSVDDLQDQIFKMDKILLDMRLRMYALYRVMLRSFSTRQQKKEKQKEKKSK